MSVVVISDFVASARSVECTPSGNVVDGRPVCQPSAHGSIVVGSAGRA